MYAERCIHQPSTRLTYVTSHTHSLTHSVAHSHTHTHSLTHSHSPSHSTAPVMTTSLTLTDDSSSVDCYVVCTSYPQLYSLRHLDSVDRLLSCISSYNHNHGCGSIEAAFTAHRRHTLIKHGRRAAAARRRDGRALITTQQNAQHALAIEQMQGELEQCQQQLQRARTERDEMQAQLTEWREAAVSAQEARECVEQQLMDAVGALPISSHPPPRDRAAQPQLTSWYRAKRRRVCNR